MLSPGSGEHGWFCRCRWRHSHFDGQADFAQHIAGVGADNRAADHLMGFHASNQLGEAFVCGRWQSPDQTLPGTRLFDLDAVALGDFFGDAHLQIRSPFHFESIPVVHSIHSFLPCFCTHGSWRKGDVDAVFLPSPPRSWCAGHDVVEAVFVHLLPHLTRSRSAPCIRPSIISTTSGARPGVEYTVPISRPMMPPPDDQHFLRHGFSVPARQWNRQCGSWG